jgi:release factor glutamine methyltransferase
MEIWTIQKLLNWMAEHFTGKGIDSPRMSAEMLLSHVLGLERIELYMHFDRQVEMPQLNRLHALVKRASEHEPIAYLIGMTEFYSLDIKVTPDTLIPRPETELLAERAIEYLRTLQTPQYMCDLCTGSGCIAAAVAIGVPEAKIIATDICDAAMAVADENITSHKLNERVHLLCGDLFSPIIEGLDQTKFDVITSNPPYIATAEYEKLDKNVRDYEPELALHAGADGLDVYRRIVKEGPKYLKPGGRLMLEIGYQQGDAVTRLLEESGEFKDITVEKDFAKNDRIVTAVKSE